MSERPKRPEAQAEHDARVVEALAHGRSDLVSELDHERAEREAALSDAIAESRDGSRELGVALRRAVPLPDDVDALVASALARSETPAPSRRSLRAGALFGTLALAASASASILLDGGATLERVLGTLRAGMTLGGAIERAILAVPGQENTVSIVLCVALCLVALGLRITSRGTIARAGGALVPFVLAATLGAGTAHAYDLEGGCGSTPVRVAIDHAPRSVALRHALASGGLGLAYSLPDDPIVSLHVGRAPLTHVLDALLGRSLARVRCAAGIVAIEPASPAPGAFPTGHVAPRAPWLASPALAPGADTGALRDVLTFGGDALVAAVDSVRDVVTMGGDARIEGRAYGNVVTMGGDADISGLVVGDVLTMGGDIRVAPEGRVHGRLSAMGGDVRDERRDTRAAMMPMAPPILAMPAAPFAMPVPEGAAPEVADFLGSAARHALVFLLGLAFLALAPGRLRVVSHALVDRPVRATFAGMLTAVGVPLLVLALCITLIGIPAAAVVAMLGIVALGAGLVASAMVVGAALPSRRLSGRPVAQLAAGVLLLFVVSRLPWVGGLAWLLALLAGLGAIALTRAGARTVASR